VDKVRNDRIDEGKPPVYPLWYGTVAHSLLTFRLSDRGGIMQRRELPNVHNVENSPVPGPTAVPLLIRSQLLIPAHTIGFPRRTGDGNNRHFPF